MLFPGSLTTPAPNNATAGARQQQYGSIKEHPSENRNSEAKASSSSDDGRATGTSMSDAGGQQPSLASTAAATPPPAFGEGTAALAGAGTGSGAGGSKDSAAGSKRKKPKNNMTKSNSSFISRVLVHESLSKRLQERPADGFFAFANINRAFQWLDLSSPKKVRVGVAYGRADVTGMTDI